MGTDTTYNFNFNELQRKKNSHNLSKYCPIFGMFNSVDFGRNVIGVWRSYYYVEIM